MRKFGIIALCASAILMCAGGVFQMLPVSKGIWIVLFFAAMYISWTVDLYLHCKCDEKKAEGSS